MAELGARHGWRIETVAPLARCTPGHVPDAARQMLSRVERLLAGRDGQPIYRSRHATTYLIQLEGLAPLTIFLKVFNAPRGIGALKGYFRGGRAHNVLEMTRALNRAGFRTPRLLLWGTEPASRRTMVVTQGAPGVALPQLLEALARQGALARKRGLLAALGIEVARLHRAGFIHGDLTPHNIFVVEEQVWRFVFLDHDRTRIGFRLGLGRRRLRNLVQMGRFMLTGLSATDRMRVFHAYASDLAPPRYRALRRQLATMLARRRARDARKS